MTNAAYLNARGGTAKQAIAALREAEGFAVQPVAPERLADALRAEVARGTPRVLVAGGDGTLSAAAAVLVDTATELAILPAGTRNHFARDHGVPDDPIQALGLARSGIAQPVDVGWVNDHLFLNTCSVGVYVSFVRVRERLERYIGYRLASLVAALSVMMRVRRFRVILHADGQERAYDTTLVFISVGQRTIGIRSPGARRLDEDSGRLLHILVPRPGTTVRSLARRYAIRRRELHAIGADLPLAEGMLTERCTIELSRPLGRVALDGELVVMEAPLKYRIGHGALRVVLP
jgi:diacylglycerol kinase family enzyme